MWLASMRRCPYCAEWIELDREKCPYCETTVPASSLERTAPFVDSSLEDLVGGLRREAESGPALRDDLGRFGGDLEVERDQRPRGERDREADPRQQQQIGRRSWQADLIEQAQDGGLRPEIQPEGSRESEIGSEQPPDRRSWEPEPDEDQPGAERPDDRQSVQQAAEQPPTRRSWEAGPEPAQPAAPKPKERRLGPFRLGRTEPKPEPERAGPEPLFVPTSGLEETGSPMRVEALEDRSSFAALPPGRRRETSSFPPADRQALLTEQGAGPSGRVSQLAGGLGRTLIALFVIGALGGGGYLLLRGPGAPLLAQLLATEVPATPTASPAPTNTLSRAPTLPPESTELAATSGADVATLTAGPEGCVLWDQVTLANEGEQLCVYGEIRRWFAVEEVPFVAIFSEEVGTFAIVDRTGVHPVGPGDCVMGRGVVEVMRGTRPNIDVQGELLSCPPS